MQTVREHAEDARALAEPGGFRMTEPLPLVPAPLEATGRPGPPFQLAEARIAAEGAARPVGDHLAARLAAVVGVVTPRADGHGPGVITLRPDPAAGPAGGYVLDVAADAVTLTAPDLPGLHAGVGALLQLTDIDAATVRPARVVDAPRFAWRGLSLDVARHFHPVGTLTALLDVMSDLRLNVLHLHLTDDQGWRLALTCRPELAERSGSTAVDGDPGGMYSADDYATIQAHAAARGVVVVPEIDLPGHVNAALHALPGLNPDGVPAPAYDGIGVGFSQLHADLPETGPFIRDVLSEVAAMTAGGYVHIGGDEPPDMPPAEYAALVRQAADAVRTAGKTVVGWQEAARADLPSGSIVQYWDFRSGADVVAAAAGAGARVLLSPADHTYLDQKYDAATPVGLEWAGHIELRDAYAWEPLDVLPEVPATAVLGIEAAVWTETIRTRDDLFFLLLPRLAAFAEVAWSAPQVRGWDGFTARVRSLGSRWDAEGHPWYRSPQVEW